MDDLERTLQDYGQAWRDAQPPPGATPVVGGAGPGRGRVAVIVAAAAAVILVVAAIAAATKGDGSHAQRVATPGPDASGSTAGAGDGSPTSTPPAPAGPASTQPSIAAPQPGIFPPSTTLPTPTTRPHTSASTLPPQTATTLPRVQPDSCPASASDASNSASSGSLPVSGVSKVTVCHYPGLNSPGAQQLDRSAAVDGSAAQQIADTLNGLQPVPTNVGYACPFDDGEIDLVEVRTSSGLDPMTVSLLGCRMVQAGHPRWWSNDQLHFELAAVLGS